MDKIYLNGLSFYGYHGVLPEETKIGQKFIIDIVLEVGLREAGKTDDLALTVNYAAVYEHIKQIVEGPPYQLIEAVAENVASIILNNYAKVEQCTVKVTKPNPPIAGHYHSVAVELKRGRADV